MSRKSARLSRKRDSLEGPVPTVSRKRKADEANLEEQISDMEVQVSKRRQQFQKQNQWIPIQQTSVNTSTILPVTVTADPLRNSNQINEDDIENMDYQTSKLSKNNNGFSKPSDSTTRTHAPLSVREEPPPVNVVVTHQSTTPQQQRYPDPPSDIFLTPEAENHAPHPASASLRFRNLFPVPALQRESPLPQLKWADSQEVWQVMLSKEEIYKHDSDMLNRHPGLQARMRSILLDWIIEVCEVYRLHRESFYLAVDFIDRYMSKTRNIAKQQLQLIGVTCLFIAAKMEEIYPPKLTEFAYVTDGACTENEILDQELVILKELKWDLCPLTVNSWLNIFLQLMSAEIKQGKAQHNFELPQYSQHNFIQIARLLDVCVLDIGILKFPYSVIATSAMYHMSSEHVALHVSGYKWHDISACVQWMAPFATTLREYSSAEVKFFQGIAPENMHNIQTHAVDLSMLEKAQARRAQIENSSRASPDYTVQYTGLVTPPQSKGKTRTSHSHS